MAFATTARTTRELQLVIVVGFVVSARKNPMVVAKITGWVCVAVAASYLLCLLQLLLITMLIVTPFL
jgi:hypothetical protein